MTTDRHSVRLPLDRSMLREVDDYVKAVNERLEPAGHVTRCSALRALIRRGLAEATRERRKG